VAFTDVIRYLVESHPGAVFVPDLKGRLPLHLACANTTAHDTPPLEVIQCLVQAWPESIHMPQGEDESVCYGVDFQSNSEDQSENGDNEFDGLEALALDLVCRAVTKSKRAQPLPELLLLLTNGQPPLHFASAQAWIPTRWTTMECLSLMYPHDRMRIHDGNLPFHNLCHAGAPRCFLEWWLEECPDAICTPTTDTNDYPLHCYLSSTMMTTSTKATKFTFFYTVIYLAEQYPPAMRSTNCMGWLPLQLAAIHGAPLDVLFYLARGFPEFGH